MFHTTGPSTLLVDRMRDFQGQLPAVFDGSEDAIHDARVALRRVSEALSLVRDDYDEHALAAIEARLSKAVRALGRVRDADCSQRLVQEVERRFPFAAATLGQLRAEFSDKQHKSRRKAIKKLEALELHMLPQQLARASHGARPRWRLASSAWQSTLRRHIAVRTDDLRTSIEQASGVYFSKRAHSVRIAIKQLRYTLELARTLGTARARGTLRLLKKAQEVLGAAHDRDVLRDHLKTLRRRHVTTINAVEADALERFLRTETLTLHQRYAEWRPDLLAICNACAAAATRRGIAARAAVVAGLGIPSLLAVGRHLRRPSPV